jgi:hypothetical protein
MIRISVIMVDGMFRESFHSIRFLAEQTLSAEQYEVIWVEYFGRLDPTLKTMLSKSTNARAITLEQEPPYHASKCFNAGIAAAKGDLIVIVDGDLCFEANFLATLAEEHNRHDRLVCYVQRYNEPPRSTPHLPCLETLRKVARLNDSFNYGACLSVRRKWLTEINGYDEHPLWATGYHRNDLDVYTRLTSLGLDTQWHPSLRVYHPWHPHSEESPRQHQRHRLMANYRSEKRQTLPFWGLNALANREPEAELLERLEFQERFLDNEEKTIKSANRDTTKSL